MSTNSYVLPASDAMTTVTIKGQVTIPKPVRDLLGIRPGSTVNFEMAADGRVVISKVGHGRRRPSRFERLRGSAGPGMTTDEIMKLMRGDD
jgi:antitoxin PrlF